MSTITTAVSTALILMFLGGMVSNIGLMKSSKKIVAFGLILVLASLIVTRILFSNFDRQPTKNPVIRYIYPWEMRERTKDNFFEIREIIGKYLQKGQPQNGCPLQKIDYYRKKIPPDAQFKLVFFFIMSMPSEVPNYTLGTLHYNFLKYFLTIALGEMIFSAQQMF